MICHFLVCSEDGRYGQGGASRLGEESGRKVLTRHHLILFRILGPRPQLTHLC